MFFTSLVTFLYRMKVGETLRQAGVGERALVAMTSSIMPGAAEEVRPRVLSWFRRLTTNYYLTPLFRGCKKQGISFIFDEVQLRHFSN